MATEIARGYPEKFMGRTFDNRTQSYWFHDGSGEIFVEQIEEITQVRGKHGDPTSEGGDVVIALFALLSANGINPSEAISAAVSTLERLETIPRYAGEETSAPPIQEQP